MFVIFSISYVALISGAMLTWLQPVHVSPHTVLHNVECGHGLVGNEQRDARVCLWVCKDG